MEKTNKLQNIQIDTDTAVMSINPEIYPIEVVQKAAYILMDKALIILGGDPKTEIKVEIQTRNEKYNIKDIVREFNEELINYAVYKDQTEKNKIIREIILQRILLTNDPKYLSAIKNTIQFKVPKDAEDLFKKWEDADKNTKTDSSNK